jgi:hypothetical protein
MEFAAFERELKSVCLEHASRDHGDRHRYTFESAEIQTKLSFNPSLAAIVKLHIHSSYDDWDDDEPFEDDYVFSYGITTNGELRRFHPHAPLSQEQVFQAYDTWGFAVERWRNLVEAHFSRATRKARFAPVHEELAQKMWHPRRVAALLESGGWEAVY